MDMREIYLDNCATTRICAPALESYIEASQKHWGNPSSRHGRGKDAEDQMREVRAIVCSAIGAQDGTVIFTSGGTEANNLALFGRVYSKARFQKNGKILTTAGEHSSVTQPLATLAAQGLTIEEIPTRGGVLDMTALRAAMTPDVVLVTMMQVNNETGACYDIAAVSALMHAQSPDAVLHIDATQAFMKQPLNIKKLGVDMVTLSSHKIEGPKGVGALWVAQKLVRNRGLVPHQLGGGQEDGLRSGTENVPGVVAFGTAIKHKMENSSIYRTHLSELREYFLERIRQTPALSELHLNLPPVAAPHIVSITLPHIKSETMVHYLSSKGIYVSSGSACSSHDTHLSSALLAYGLNDKDADCTVRVSFGAQNTREDVDELCDALATGVSTLIRVRG